MRNAFLSIAVLAALAVSASTADARPRQWVRSYYGGPSYYYTPRVVYPGASYYYAPGYYNPGYYTPGYYSGYRSYYRPSGFSFSLTPGYGFSFGYSSGGYAYPYYGGYRGWRW